MKNTYKMQIYKIFNKRGIFYDDFLGFDKEE